MEARAMISGSRSRCHLGYEPWSRYEARTEVWDVPPMIPVNITEMGLKWTNSFLLYARLKKRTYYAMAMSVRPRFRDFFSTCFEILIWNLVYTFSRWHNMSSLSCITIRSLWPSLQQKVIFRNHGLINQDKFFKFDICLTCCILLD